MGQESFDGRWTTASGESVTIEGDIVHGEDGSAVPLQRLGEGEFLVPFQGMGDFRCKRDAQGRLVWSDGDVWSLSQTAEQLRREAEAELSRQRVAAAGGAWRAVLGLEAGAGIEEIKRAFHELALLHHPDKGHGQGGGGGDDGAATFKLVQKAYEQGLRECELALEKAKAAASAVSVLQPETGCRVLVSAPKRELREALDRWENLIDTGKSEHIVDEVPVLTLDEVVNLLLDGKCVPVDVRQPEEKCGSMRDPLPGGVSISYMSLLKSPEIAAKELAALQRRTDHGCDGRSIVCYSTNGGTSGTCGAACCILMDVFGFNEEAMFTLETGYLGWHRWRKTNEQVLSKMPRPH